MRGRDNFLFFELNLGEKLVTDDLTCYHLVYIPFIVPSTDLYTRITDKFSYQRYNVSRECNKGKPGETGSNI